MRIRLLPLAVLLLMPGIAGAGGEQPTRVGPSEAALIWARDTVAARLKEPVPGAAFPVGLDWLGVERPLSLAQDLRGKIVLLDFWTFCCINCMHVLPDLAYLEKTYGARGLAVIGVHSAKFDNEKGTEQIRDAMRRYGIHHPVVNDNAFAIWRSYGVRSWPTFVLLTPEGNVLGRLSGEGQREDLEALIVALLERYEGKLDKTPLPLRPEQGRRPAGPLAYPGKVAVSADGKRIWIADTGHNRIVEVDAAGHFLRAFGDGTPGLRDGVGTAARFAAPQGLAEHAGALYVCDTENHALRRIDLATSAVTTVAGTGAQGNHRDLFRKAGHGPWPAKETALNSPWDLVFVQSKAYVAMAGSHTLWTYNPKAGTVAHFAGDGTERRLDAKNLQEAAFAQPSGITWDGMHLYVADSESSAIVRVGLTEGVETIAGGADEPTDLFHYGDEDGVGRGRRFQHPLAVLFHEGVLYVADSYNHKIKTVDRETGAARTLLASGVAGAPGGGASLREPGGLAAHGKWLWIANTNAAAIRRHLLDGGGDSDLPLARIPIPQAQVRASGVGTAWPRLPGTVYPAPLTADVRAGVSLPISIEVRLPEGWHFTEGAPAAARLEIGGTVVDAGVRNGQAVLAAGKLAPGRHEIVVRLLYYACQAEGDCRVRSVSWKLILTAKAEGKEALLLSDTFEP